MRARDPVTGKFVRIEPAAVEKALVAAASALPTQDIDRLPRVPKSEQERAWKLWRILGVLHAPTTAKARQVGRLKWNVSVGNRELSPEAAEEAMKAITAPLTVGEASRRLALNLEIAGEVWYMRRSDEWNVYAATTPKLKELMRAADIRVRGWTPDPENPQEPYSAVMAALGTADAIRLMASLSRSQDRNRLAQRGILMMPKEAQFPDDDPFKPNLEMSILAPINDELSGSAAVPLVVDLPADLIEKVRHIVMESPYDDKLMGRIEQAVHQLALELDIPPEKLLGNMDSNHWNAWLSSEENYREYVEPLGQEVGQVYAQAMMEAVPDSEKIVVTPDPAELLTSSPSVDDAFRALELLAVGYDYVRRIIGADEADAPDDDEIERILRATGKTATAPEAPADSAPPMLPAGSPNGNGQPVTAAVDDDAAGLERLGRQLTDIDIRLLSILEGLTGMAVDHARQAVAADEVGAPALVADEMQRLGKAWNREVTRGRATLKALGIDTKGPEWDRAQEASVDLLTDEIAAFVTDNLDKTDSEAPAVPVLTLRRVLAAAGGSGTATVAAVTRNPAPTFQDPQGFALGVKTLSALKEQDVELVQWRFRYFKNIRREHPFEEHVAVDGQFMTADGFTSEGFYPGDHRGDLCGVDPVFRRASAPEEVEDEVDA